MPKGASSAFLDQLVRDAADTNTAAVPSLAEVECFAQRRPEDAESDEAVSTAAREIGRMAGRLVTQRRLFLTHRHKVSGMCSLSPRRGDEVWMVRDCAAPLILRPVSTETAESAEERYVHGFMNGQFIEERENRDTSNAANLVLSKTKPQRKYTVACEA
ncbi:hypothetical protein P171DRAFT_524613 [Karstenula rhodostoma CBS 690.94]|uniref:Uncharacterized protein n=1 Tax=Karstenula rhodostoma CBS 690.94 TaxID=1392251 RepID=A0A9P4PAZ4_9PLEO|nr:hypothetical protein P171DRAFT_524613 [Karstenula rhodostoma CBS 690.94]